ncbi:SHOCT domain-containing protein [Microbacterium sp. No. 7]|uniref:SHOCT domain-containing protein n=1 Tax=Microbacterium sp. No. 7 TaxID=1714373 RepID=UPI0006D26490|nr:SHOCT domain-containing protein [Microbacterium sp. No. 7]ALJ19957.1 hypothetical protein AOA12_08565 [Microbacterium sp. No. 7]
MRFVNAPVEYQGFWGSFWDLIWWFLAIFVFIAYIYTIFAIISDLFRDRKLGGVAKAIWIIFLVFLPFLTALVYLIARGGGMGERASQQAQAYKDAQDAYIREVAGISPAEQIAQAKGLLESGAITQEEFDRLKSKALA